MVIKAKGYSFGDYELGEKVLHEGQIFEVIGFDEVKNKALLNVRDEEMSTVKDWVNLGTMAYEHIILLKYSLRDHCLWVPIDNISKATNIHIYPEDEYAKVKVMYQEIFGSHYAIKSITDIKYNNGVSVIHKDDLKSNLRRINELNRLYMKYPKE